MLNNWFAPISDQLAAKARKFGILGHEDEKDFPLLDHCQIAIIGFNENFANHIREILYDYANHFSGLSIIDLGNFRNSDIDFITPAIKELVESNIKIISLGMPQRIVRLMAKRIESSRKTITCLSNRIGEFDEDDMLDVLGFQRHLVSDQQLLEIEQVSYNSMSLAKTQAQAAVYEAILLDTYIGHIDGNVIRLSDNPSCPESQSSGFDCLQLCQSSLTMGRSSQLQVLNFSNTVNNDLDLIGNTTIAESIWYAIEGIFKSKESNDEDLQEFVLQASELDAHITFVKCNSTGRWWMKNQNGQLVSCAYEEYMAAANGDIPDRLVRNL